MRVRLATETYRLEFEGSPSVWNECFRPIFGGPEAPPDPPPLATAEPASAPGAQGMSPAAPQAHAAAFRAPTPAAGSPSAAPPTAAPLSAATVRTFVMPRREPARDPRDARERDPRDPRDGRDGRDSYRDGPRDAAHGENFGGGGGPEGQSDWRRRRGGPEPTILVEPAADPNVLYQRLSGVESRRAEKDAILAAVWFVGRAQRDVSPEEVEKHLREHGGPPDVKVRPHMQKHITRTKLMEPGEQNGWVRLSAKGRAQIRLLVGE